MQRFTVACVPAVAFFVTFAVLGGIFTIAVLGGTASTFPPWSGVAAVAFATSPLLALHLFTCARYMTVNELVRWPLLYLRSFHEHASSEFFRTVIAPNTDRYGIVVAIGNDGAERYELQRSLPLLKRPFVEWHGGPAWQDAVRSLMQRAGAVIVDATGDTAGLRWELDQIAATVPPERVIIVGNFGLATMPGWARVAGPREPGDVASARTAMHDALQRSLPLE
jgi:hypothetical protein